MHTRFYRKTLLLSALVLALVLCLGGAAWADEPYPDAVPLTLNAEAYASIQNGGDYAYFRFTPSVTRQYNFTSNGSNDTYGYLYDAAGNTITEDDDSGSGRNFSITRTLEAGTTYYFGARYYFTSNTGSFSVILSFENGLTVSAIGETWPTAAWGESLTMAVSASCSEGGLHYQWFQRSYSGNEYGDTVPISGATASSFTLERATRREDFYCRVTDDFGGSREVWFYVSVENGLTVSAASETMVLAEPGERVSFRVEASCDHGTLHYRWVSEMNPDLSGGDAPQFTMTAAQRDWITCIVSDECGNEEWIDFTLVVKTGLWAFPVADAYDQSQAVIEVPRGQTTVLRVEAGSDAGPLSYSWRSDNLGELTFTGPECTTGPIYETDYYHCTVSDGTGESWYAHFKVRPGMVRLSLNVETPVVITEPGEICDFLFTPAESGDYVFFSTGELDTAGMLFDDNGMTVSRDSGSGAGDNFQLRLNLTAGQTYHLGAYTYDTGSFVVRMVPDTHLNAEADNAYPTVKAREDLTMTVSVSGGTPPLSCQWYRIAYDDTQQMDVRTPIAGATARSYTWRADGPAPSFECEVTDGSGVTVSASFYPNVPNGFYVYAGSFFDRYVPLGETTELRVNARCDVGSLSYRWYDDDYETTLSATDVLTTAPVTAYKLYGCEVTDEYGNGGTVYFNVHVDNGLTVTPVDTVRVPAELGGSAVLEVSASCLRGDIHYVWKDYNWHEIQTDTGASSVCTVSNVRTAAEYRCVVTDDYGNETTIYFEVYVDDGFTARAEGAADAEETKIVTVPLGGTAVLKVIAFCNADFIYYQWYNDTSGRLISGEETDSLTVENVQSANKYICIVSDDYGNEATIRFEVRVDNAFTAEAVGKTVFCAQRGDTVTLSVNASCREGSPSCWWIKSGYGDMSNAGNGPSISVQVNARIQLYVCIVSDQYGNQENIYFLVVDPDIVLPEGLLRVESEAFAGMRELVVWVPPSVEEIAPDAFDPTTYVIGEPGTYAETYAGTRPVDIRSFMEEGN